ncbi:SH3 domain-containing protein [Kribbella solani]|uniref:SH3 domain-containing protein n=1 Tax=Kribbella solani TaxID=236067 RepID=A0A841DS37_9ACTN|nr:SH3 domain-containing protein [Kribbella solani]MBB5979715.1 hypothetical protein [Kribbella solani]MDX2970200.1 SH3 domain-containing protein [Kribbella solani]MDX3004721.1 SH3 domain-containing protein [Kribbella solani]
MTLRDELPTAGDLAVPSDVIAGIAVFDRQTGGFVQQLNADLPFRSASVVKLLIVLDLLWERGPRYEVDAADQERLEVMLRSSDDDAASYYWEQRGGSAIVDRMIDRLGLTHTAGPPVSHPGFWGYVAITAADTVRIYQYLLDRAPAPVRQYVMDLLHRPTRYGTDGFDQYFGIASVFDPDFSIKQGWSGFHGSSGYQSDRAKPEAVVDLVSDALHTTGTVGVADRSIVSVFTLHPAGTPYGKAYTDVTRLTRELTVPGAVRTAGSWVLTTGDGVRVRSAPNTSGGILGHLPSGVEVLVSGQAQGELIDAPPRSSNWWAYLPKYGGYVTNVYIGSGAPKLPGVPVCQ